MDFLGVESQVSVNERLNTAKVLGGALNRQHG